MVFSAQIGKRLREERERLGLSQTEAAESANVRREQWSKYERDQAEPGVTVLVGFSAQGADVMYIVTGIPADAHARLAMKQRSLEMAAESEKGIDGIKRRGAVYEAAMKAALSKEELELMENWRHCEKEDQAAISRIANSLAAAQPKRGKKKL